MRRKTTVTTLDVSGLEFAWLANTLRHYDYLLGQTGLSTREADSEWASALREDWPRLRVYLQAALSAHAPPEKGAQKKKRRRT